MIDKIRLFNKLEDCCGCGACMEICPKNAIEMVLEHEFYYPKINHEKCIKCQMCLKICTFKDEGKENECFCEK